MTGIPESLWAGLLGNSFTFIVRNLVPPVFPWAPAWNQKMDEFLATPFGTHFRSFQSFGRVERGTGEEGMGFGLVPVLFVVASLVAGLRHRRRQGVISGAHDRILKLVSWGLGLATLAFLAKLASSTNARLFAAFYIPGLAALLGCAAQARVVRRPWWRRLAALVMVSSIGLVVLSRARPLWPAGTVMKWAGQHWPQSKLVGLVARSYAYRSEADRRLDDILASLPPEQKVIGTLSWAPTEGHLWKPYGTRLVVHICAEHTPEQIRAMNIRYVVLSAQAVKDYPEGSVENWTNKWRGEIVQTIRVCLNPEAPQEDDELVHIARLR